MKVTALQRLRARLAADEPVYGLWITLESPSITEMAVAVGLDWVVIDAEHGHLDWRDIVNHIRAAVRSHTVVMVRIAESNAALVKRVLDIGADGIVVPWMESADEVAEIVRFAHYPPAGVRGIGGERATVWGKCFAQHVTEADESVLVVPIIESVKASDSIDDIATVPGVDLYYFGPADFSATAGHAGEWEGGDVAQRILTAKDAIRANGRQCGLLGTSNADLQQRLDQGFRVLGFGLDSGMLFRGLNDCLSAVGLESTLSTAMFSSP